MTVRVLLVVTVAAMLHASAAFGACPGDCDDDGSVGINEVVIAVRISLNETSVDACRPVDSDVDGVVTISELIQAVRSGLDGCPLCGNGRIDPGEECDAGDPTVQCFTDCTVCCSFDCITSRCCWDGPEGGLVRFDPECRNCGEVGQGCGYTALYDLTCCGGLQCGELSEIGGRALFGTCCPPAGSSCLTDDDCCGGSEFFSSPGDACVEGTCCVRGGGLCEPGAANPCCDAAERCLQIPNTLWHTCRVPPPLPEPCVEEFCATGDFEAACCGENRACERVVRAGVRACCGQAGAPCSRNFKADCCSGICRIDDDGNPVCE